MRIGVVAQQHALPRPHEADRAARAVESRLEQRAGGHQRHQRLRCRDAAARGYPERGQRARLRGGDDDLALRLGLGQLLVDLGDLAVDVGELQTLAQRRLVPLGRELQPAALERRALALERLQRQPLVERILLRLAQVLLDDEVAVAELALPCQRRVGEIDACPLELELPLHLGELGVDHREPRGLRRDLRREERPVVLPLGDQAVAPGPERPEHLALRGAHRLRPPLGREHRQRRAGGDLEPLLRS